MATCFIISPIGESGSEIRRNADDLRDMIIKPVMELFNLTVVRGDHRSEAGQIDVDVIHAVQESELCVVDLSLPNPNVYYELGRRDETGKPVILLKAKNSEDLPVDIATRRYIEYDLDDRRGLMSAIQQLRNFVEPLVKSGFESSGAGTSLSDIANTLNRLERKVDRLVKGGSTGRENPPIIPGTIGDEDPLDVFKLALRERNVPLAEQAMDQLQVRMSKHKWLDVVVEQVAAMGSMRAGDILLENMDEFLDDAATLHEKIEYLGCLVSNLNRTDRELENLERVERACSEALASCDGEDPDDVVQLYNQPNRLYYGIYATTGDRQWLLKAIATLRKALEITEKNYLHFNLAMCLRKSGSQADLEEARDHILRCLQMDGSKMDDDHLEEGCTILHALEDPRTDDLMELLAKVAPIKARLLRDRWRRNSD